MASSFLLRNLSFPKKGRYLAVICKVSWSLGLQVRATLLSFIAQLYSWMGKNLATLFCTFPARIYLLVEQTRNAEKNLLRRCARRVHFAKKHFGNQSLKAVGHWSKTHSFQTIYHVPKKSETTDDTMLKKQIPANKFQY